MESLSICAVMESLSMHAHARLLLQETAPPSATPIPATATASPRPASSDHSGAAPSSSSTPSVAPISPFNVSPQFSPTMVIILVILLSAFFFMGFFAIYVRRCTTDDSFSQRGGNARGGRSRREDAAGLQHGLGVDPSVVEKLPMVSYAAAKKKGCNECVICLAEFERDEELKQLRKCKHVFHPGCIGMWLESHTTCPLCRRSLVNADKWSMSWRWGGSSRGASSSGRINEGDSSRSRRSGEQGAASPGLVTAGSGHGEVQQLPTSSARPASSSLIEIVSVADLPQAGCTFCGRSEVAALPQGTSGLARKNGTSRISAELGVVSMMHAAALQGRRRLRLGRSNSTGHSLRKEAMSRAAAAATQAAPQTGCMAQSEFPLLLRSRSIGREEEEVKVHSDSGTSSEQSPVRAGGCTRAPTSILPSEK